MFREPSERAAPCPQRARAVLLFVVLAVNTVTMPRFEYAGDPAAVRDETRTLLLDGGLCVPPDVALGRGEPGNYFVQNPSDGSWHAKYGVLNTLMNVPPLATELLLTGELPADGGRTRVLLLNLWNVVLSLLLAWLLLDAALLFTPWPALALAYVLAVFYGTFTWNYLRAQTSEITQILFFVAAFLAYVRWVRRAGAGGPLRARDLAVVWAFVGALALVRFTYLLLVPLVWAGAWHRLRAGARVWHLPPGWLAALALPTALILSVLGAVNAHRFGAPWLTGYHTCGAMGCVGGLEMRSLSASFLDGAWGLLFRVTRSVFIHFPVLALALLAWRRFAGRFPFEARAIAASALAAYAFNVVLPQWQAEWSYGPRYLVFVLPVAALPALVGAEAALAGAGWRRTARLGAIAAVLLYSMYWQVQVNRLEFFAYYRIRDPFDRVSTMDTAEYFLNRHFGAINRDLVRARDDLESLPYLKELRRRARADVVERYRRGVLEYYARNENYFWF